MKLSIFFLVFASLWHSLHVHGQEHATSTSFRVRGSDVESTAKAGKITPVRHMIDSMSMSVPIFEKDDSSSPSLRSWFSATSVVANQIDKPLTIITFNNADFVYQSYNQLYQVAPYGQAQVEAAPDFWGLKVGIVYGMIGDHALYRMWFCPNGSTLSVQSIYYDQIYTDGCEHIGTNQISTNSDTMSMIFEVGGLTVDALSAAGGFFFV